VTNELLPLVTLEILVTLDEWTAIRYAVEDIAARVQYGWREVPFSLVIEAVREVLGQAAVDRMRGHVVGFRPLPLGALPPRFEDRFCVPVST
jgi:hypothetical protein